MTINEMYEKRPRTIWIKLGISAIIIGLVIWSAMGVKYNGVAAKGSEVALGVINGLLHPDT
ncbi:MAG: phosphonate ABC transporter, permease protein PhnE, partial [Erysipelotrichaceae bacterium]|nr:phosphonate ABC transporter, permease protein PhnE [Erysipelotrichaceae bacterium]